MKALDPKRPKIDYPTIEYLTDLWNYLGKHKKNFILGSIARLVSDLLWLYPAVALGKIVNILSSNSVDIRLIWLEFIFLAVIAVLSPSLRNLGKALIYKATVDSNQNLRIKAAKHLMYLPAHWHEKEGSGAKFQRLNTAGDALGVVYGQWINNIIEIGVNLVGIPFIFFQLDRTFGFSVVTFVIIYVLLQARFTDEIANIQHEVNLATEVASSSLFEAISNVRTVRLLGAINIIVANVSSKISKFVRIVWYRINKARAQGAILLVYFQVFRVGMYGLAVKQILEGKIEIGFLLVLVTYLGRLWESTDDLGSAYQELVIAKYGLARARELFAEPIISQTEDNKTALPRDWKKLELNNISFDYGGKGNKGVLRNVSLAIKRGQKVGIIGLSGAGKSTLFKLLLKEYEDYRGEIKFDNLSLREISPKDYYDHTAVVLQETEVFNLSLKENITIGREKFDSDAFERALDVAHVREFLHKLPNGVDTIIGEKGVKLSGGEKQRLGIARAVYKEPELLLMDEATSHLDIESEKTIQESLSKFFDTVTAVVIAHRLTTIKEMDRIIVLEGGKIVEEGSFSKLMRLPRGRFKELWKKQEI